MIFTHDILSFYCINNLRTGVFMILCRFCELRADYDQAQDKIRQLERDTESQRRSMEEQEERHKTMYLKMYMKGQEAAKFEHADQVRRHKSMHRRNRRKPDFYNIMDLYYQRHSKASSSSRMVGLLVYRIILCIRQYICDT